MPGGLLELSSLPWARGQVVALSCSSLTAEQLRVRLLCAQRWVNLLVKIRIPPCCQMEELNCIQLELRSDLLRCPGAIRNLNRTLFESQACPFEMTWWTLEISLIKTASSKCQKQAKRKQKELANLLCHFSHWIWDLVARRVATEHADALPYMLVLVILSVDQNMLIYVTCFLIDLQTSAACNGPFNH